jgi:hypothetical protein
LPGLANLAGLLTSLIFRDSASRYLVNLHRDLQ